MNRQSGVGVEPVEGYNALKMIWTPAPTGDEIHIAFKQIREYLDASDTTVNIIVDLLCFPVIPVMETFYYGLQEVFTHSRMGTWLVVGGNKRARIVANLMNKFQGRDNILWFTTEAEAFERLEALR